ncbi:MAG TPA: AbgT family transporter [Acidimicrobiales bacterium]|jgi:aminobenzoyl-glutamate transport protein
MADSTETATDESGGTAGQERGMVQKLLDRIETVGNKVPHPAIIFLGLCVLVIVLSAVLAAFDVRVTYDVVEQPPIAAHEEYVGGSVQPETVVNPDAYLDENLDVHQETTEIKSLLSTDGIRFIFSSFVDNFASFSVVAVVFVAMIGVGVAEEAGLMAALIRKLVAVAPAGALTFIIVFVGGLSSVATDAGYLILIPLAAAAFLSVGRHPLAGLAAAYAGVSAGFAVNVLLTPLDGLLTEVTNESIALVDPSRSIDLTANLWFAIASTIFVALVITMIAQRITEPALGAYDGGGVVAADEEEVPAGEGRGLRFATWGLLAAVAVVTLLTVLPSAPLRNPETGSIFNNSPLMDSLIFIITTIFLVAGICYGLGAKTITSSVDVINAITKTFAGLSGLVFLLLLISQFIAYFNFSNMPTVAAVKMADMLESADIGALWLLIGFILVIVILDVIIPGSLPKWAIFAPIFVPLFLRLDVAPQTVLAAYRVGDSPANVVTPLMVYLPFIVLVAQRYRKDAGIGTIISLMIPYTVIVLVAWMAFFVAWYLLGIPMGPGYPAHL